MSNDTAALLIGQPRLLLPLRAALPIVTWSPRFVSISLASEKTPVFLVLQCR